MKHFSLILVGLLLATTPCLATDRKYGTYLQQLQPNVLLGQEKFKSEAFTDFEKTDPHMGYHRYYRSPRCGISLYVYDLNDFGFQKNGDNVALIQSDTKNIPVTPAVMPIVAARVYSEIYQFHPKLTPPPPQADEVLSKAILIQSLADKSKKTPQSHTQVLSGTTPQTAEAVGVLDYKGNILKSRVTCHSPKEKDLSETIAKQGLLWMKSEFDKKK